MLASCYLASCYIPDGCCLELQTTPPLRKGHEGSCQVERTTYPEVDVEVACASELAVANLEGDGHGVILVQALVEALAAVGGQDDVVGSGGLEDGGGEEGPRSGEEVHGRRWVVAVSKERYMDGGSGKGSPNRSLVDVPVICRRCRLGALGTGA